MSDYHYSAEEIAKADLLNHQRKCYRDHVTPLLALNGLPTGTVITKEYDSAADHDFWEIQIGADTYRGVDIIQLLSSLQQ
jgi:hypothetical protein